MMNITLKKVIYAILAVIVFTGLLFAGDYLYYVHKVKVVTQNKQKAVAIYNTIEQGAGSQFSTQSYYQDKANKVAQIVGNLQPNTPEYYQFKLDGVESSILGNILAKDDTKKPIALDGYNQTYAINQQIEKNNKNDKTYYAPLSESVVAASHFYEQYCFRTEWFLESNWAKDPVFVKFLTKYQNTPRAAIFLGFSQKLNDLPEQDNITIGTNMRVVSYLLHSFKATLTQEDVDILIARLVSLRALYINAPTSKMVKNSDKNEGVLPLVVTPAIEYAYATEILSRYKPELVPAKMVTETYDRTIADIKLIADSNNRPIYIVNKLMWVDLMYLGYMYEQKNSTTVTKRMYDIAVMVYTYTNAKHSTVVEGKETANSYQQAANTELGSWDQIRKRGYPALDAVTAAIKKGTFPVPK